jgi:pimeloyl-ACP methyl ester carboxylesterase
MDTPESQYVETEDGTHIGYQVFGEGPDLVLSEGWMSNIDANWDLPDAQYPDFLRAMARRFRVITFDRRGFGISDRPESASAMPVEKSMDDMRAVMDAVGCERALLAGFESGATVSVLFAATLPERTRGLILMAPLVYSRRTPDFPWGWTDVEEREWDDMIRQHWGTERFWEFNFASMGDVPDRATLRAWAKWSRLCASPRAALAIEQVERQVDVRAVLPQIQVPTLVLLRAGDADRGTWGAARWVSEQIPGARYVEIPGTDHFFFANDTELFDEIDSFVTGIGRHESRFERVLSTVLFTDICGSTATASALGDREWRAIVERHHAVVRAMLGRYRGVEVDTAGDGFFATFDGPARAIYCARDIVEAVRPLGIEIRAGVHTGECETIDGKVGGMAVVIGARVGSLAVPSEVLVSQTVRDLVAGSGLEFHDRGAHELKGIPDRWQVYAAATG